MAFFWVYCFRQYNFITFLNKKQFIWGPITMPDYCQENPQKTNYLLGFSIYILPPCHPSKGSLDLWKKNDFKLENCLKNKLILYVHESIKHELRKMTKCYSMMTSLEYAKKTMWTSLLTVIVVYERSSNCGVAFSTSSTKKRFHNFMPFILYVHVHTVQNP